MREEYPRPEFARKEWMSLNGAWDFFVGDEEGKKQIEVPFVCQSKLSGIGEEITDDCVVYERGFIVPNGWKGRKVLLNFGAVDYGCKVWVNHQCVGEHTGGQTPFHFDITPYLNWETEHIRVEVEDPLKDEGIARGKQFWEAAPRFIWYTPSTGIWQSVWLEPVAALHLDWVQFTPDIDKGIVRIDYQLGKCRVMPCAADLEIRFGDQVIFQGTVECRELKNSLAVDVFQNKALNGSFHFTSTCWSPEHPNLYDVTIKLLKDGQVTDCTESYFGMRKIHVEREKIYLNNQPYYQKLLLDQGYWKEGLVTAPDDDDYRRDILMSKAMGFNGCRKHEKVEDPRFLYWADHLGFLVWGAMASFWSYSPQNGSAFMKEWIDVIQRDYNHPSIVVWGMLNESWGVPRIYSSPEQQAFAQSLYYMAHSLDATRLVISNDGWEMTDTDICAVHSYKHGAKDDARQQQVFADSLKTMEGLDAIAEKLAFAKGYGYRGQPVLLTEFGGISVSDKEEDWGYTATSRSEFLEEFRRIVEAVYDSDLMGGGCYTQLADVQQESNGLLTEDHEYKFDPEKIREIMDLHR